MDIKSKDARSENMAKIRSKDTRPELFIRSSLSERNYHFIPNCPSVEGRPDLYFDSEQAAIFIHGCYWHRHAGCKYAYTPKSNVEFWLAKFEANQKRDAAVFSALQTTGVRILIIWECTVRKMRRDKALNSQVMAQIEGFLRDESLVFLEI
jgi:DNA mismatch endonuclease (patch repair protein)